MEITDEKDEKSAGIGEIASNAQDGTDFTAAIKEKIKQEKSINYDDAIDIVNQIKPFEKIVNYEDLGITAILYSQLILFDVLTKELQIKWDQVIINDIFINICKQKDNYAAIQWFAEHYKYTDKTPISVSSANMANLIINLGIKCQFDIRALLTGPKELWRASYFKRAYCSWDLSHFRNVPKVHISELIYMYEKESTLLADGAPTDIIFRLLARANDTYANEMFWQFYEQSGRSSFPSAITAIAIYGGNVDLLVQMKCRKKLEWGWLKDPAIDDRDKEVIDKFIDLLYGLNISDGIPAEFQRKGK